MAKIFVKVPAHWPDLKVTSFLKPGSHATGHAIDLAFARTKPPLDRGLGGNFWFYYMQTAHLLWGAQRSGIVNIAKPPQCPHYHCELNTKRHSMGVEDTRYINGVCVFKGMVAQLELPLLKEVNAQLFKDSTVFIRQVHDLTGDYVGGFDNYMRQLALTLEKPEKYISVDPNGFLSDEDLQRRLILLFGDDSTSQAVADNVSHMIGYVSADDAKQNALSDLLSNPWIAGLSLAAVAYIAYQAAKEHRYWQLTTQPPK